MSMMPHVASNILANGSGRAGRGGAVPCCVQRPCEVVEIDQGAARQPAGGAGHNKGCERCGAQPVQANGERRHR